METTILTEEQRAIELKTTLYYDLLDRYVQLKQTMAEYQNRIVQLKLEVISYRKDNDSERTVVHHNAFIDNIISILYRNKGNTASIIELQKLKLIS